MNHTIQDSFIVWLDRYYMVWRYIDIYSLILVLRPAKSDFAIGRRGVEIKWEICTPLTKKHQVITLQMHFSLLHPHMVSQSKDCNIPKQNKRHINISKQHPRNYYLTKGFGFTNGIHMLKSWHRVNNQVLMEVHKHKFKGSTSTEKLTTPPPLPTYNLKHQETNALSNLIYKILLTNLWNPKQNFKMVICN